MIRTLYSWTMNMAQSPYALWVLAFVAFIEASVFPIPTEVLFIPMILAMPKHAWLYAAVATLASVAGGVFGYWLGSTLFETIGQPVLAFYGKAHHIDTFRENYAEWGAWAVLFAGITPFPYKVITIASGAAHLNFSIFVAASLLARAVKFFLVALLLWKFGEPIRQFIERRLGLVTLVGFAVVIGGFVLLKFV